MKKYRYRFPIVFDVFWWGFSIYWQRPISKPAIAQATKPISSDPQDSMIIYYSVLDDD